MILLFLLVLAFGILLPTIRVLLYAVRGEDRLSSFLRVIGDVFALIILPCMFFIMVNEGIQTSSTFSYPCSLLLLVLILLCVLIYFYNEAAPTNLSRPMKRFGFDVFLLLGAGLALLTGIHIANGAGLITNLPITSLFLLALHKSYKSSRNLIQSSLAGVKYGSPEILDDPSMFAEEEASTNSLSPFWAQIFELHGLQYLSLLACAAIGVLVLVSLIGGLLGLSFDCMITTFTESYQGYFAPGL